MSQLQINSLPIDERFLSAEALSDLDALTEDREIPTDSLFDDLGIQSDTDTKTPEPISDRPIALSEVEELILGFLESKPEQNFTASEIRKNVARLKESTETELLEKICEGLVKTERVIRVSSDGRKPRYMAP